MSNPLANFAIAILTKAVSDYLDDEPRTWFYDEKHRREAQEDAREFLASPSEGLVACCEAADIDPDYLLKGMRGLDGAPKGVRAQAKADLGYVFLHTDPLQSPRLDPLFSDD